MSLITEQLNNTCKHPGESPSWPIRATQEPSGMDEMIEGPGCVCAVLCGGGVGADPQAVF